MSPWYTSKLKTHKGTHTRSSPGLRVRRAACPGNGYRKQTRTPSAPGCRQHTASGVTRAERENAGATGLRESRVHKGVGKPASHSSVQGQGPLAWVFTLGSRTQNRTGHQWNPPRDFSPTSVPRHETNLCNHSGVNSRRFLRIAAMLRLRGDRV